jgi:hypothetical protein
MNRRNQVECGRTARTVKEPAKKSVSIRRSFADVNMDNGHDQLTGPFEDWYFDGELATILMLPGGMHKELIREIIIVRADGTSGGETGED